MKTFLTILSILSLALFASCGGGTSEDGEVNSTSAAGKAKASEDGEANSTSAAGKAKASEDGEANSTSAVGKAKGSASASDLFDGPLLDAKGTEVSKEALVGKTIGLYFSAHWCPPCRSFTPTLVKFRDANKKEFEVVFVSSDRSPKDQMAYMKETGMKWYTMPHRSSAANALAKKYGISGIPALVIVSPDGKTITKNGRSDVTNNAKGAIKSWAKKSS
jgi:nucleoredoxin